MILGLISRRRLWGQKRATCPQSDVDGRQFEDLGPTEVREP